MFLTVRLYGTVVNTLYRGWC